MASLEEPPEKIKLYFDSSANKIKELRKSKAPSANQHTPKINGTQHDKLKQLLGEMTRERGKELSERKSGYRRQKSSKGHFDKKGKKRASEDAF